METRAESVCGFCRIRSGTYRSNGPSLREDVVGVISSVFGENPPKEEQKRPAQISIYKEDVNDVLKMNGFVKDVIDVAAKQFASRSPEAGFIRTLFGQMNSFTEEIMAKAKKMSGGSYMTPILFSKMESESIYRILDTAERLYGKFIIQWFRTKSKKDWPEWRKIFYENAWHLGSFVRHGRPAKNPSPWLTGERPPLDDDPFGKIPIGKER
jgi:hypothetical protein